MIKGLLSALMVFVFLGQQFAFAYNPAENIPVTTSMKKMLVQQAVAGYSGMTAGEKAQWNRSLSEKLNKAEAAVESLSEEQFSEVVKSNLNQIRNQPFEGDLKDMISQLDDAQVDTLLENADDELVLVESDKRKVLAMTLAAEAQLTSNMSADRLSGMTKGDFVRQIKVVREFQKSNLVGDVLMAFILSGFLLGVMALAVLGGAGLLIAGLFIASVPMIVSGSLLLALGGGLIIWACID